MAKIVYYMVEHKNPLNFMKFNRKEYDLIYDAFQYMEFKMSKDQKRLAEQILDSAFYPDTETEKDHAHLLSYTSKWFTKKS